MGLNHQAASLSCALGEAHFLNRTLLLPDAICLSGLHTERWRAAGQPAGEVCVPLGELWNVGLLSQLVPLMLVPHNLTQAMRGAARRPGGAASRVARVGPSWPSARVMSLAACCGLCTGRTRVGVLWLCHVCGCGLYVSLVSLPLAFRLSSSRTE